MAMGGMGGGKGSLSDINVTPLVDVMLVLLVVFMVTVPMIDAPPDESQCKREVEIDLPKTESKKTVTDGDLQTIIEINKAQQILISRGVDDEGEAKATELVSCRDQKDDFSKCLEPLQAKLEAMEYLHDGRRIFFMADRTLPYGLVVDVMARIKNADIHNLGMVTNPPEKSG